MRQVLSTWMARGRDNPRLFPSGRVHYVSTAEPNGSLAPRADTKRMTMRISLRVCQTVLALFALPLAALPVLAVTAPAKAQDAVAQFYRGKQINLYIGTSAGGGYDTYARLLAR